ncbi:MAG: hypothetical protein KA163_07215 [Bacteroidia bacterium]|nr:hypothetical protein [Bacteroidia bacterium]
MEKKKRNIAAEILNLKTRKEFESYSKIHAKLDKIQDCIVTLDLHVGTEREELLKYIPVALVATMESFFRSTIAKLIKADSKYLENSRTLFETKFDFEEMTRLQRREFSIGELLAHQLSFSKYDIILNHFDVILKVKFKEELIRYSVKSVYSGFEGPHPKDFGTNYERIKKDLFRVFELRHIICHEMSTKLNLSGLEVEQLFKSVRAFIYQVYNYTYSILYPESLLSNEDLRNNALKNYNEALQKLSETIKKIEQKPYTVFDIPIDLQEFKRSQELWKNYIEAYTNSLYTKMGGLYSEIYRLQDITDLINERTDDLDIEFFTEE